MRRIVALPLALGLSACSLSADRARPSLPALDAETRDAFLRGGDEVVATPPTARWWDSLGDPILTRLIEEAFVQSPSIDVATARIVQARAGLAANRTSILPSVGTSFAVPYINLPAGSLGLGSGGDRVDSTTYSLGFDASWELDLFGGNRHKVESASAKAQGAEAGLADARVSLSSEVARAYVALRLRQAMLAVQDRQADIDRDLVALANQRFRAGTAPAQPLDQARSQLAQSESDLARSRGEVTVLIDQIALLTGQEPGAFDSLLVAATPIPLPPAQVAVGDPASLLRNRPDIRVAERQLATATADVGVKVAARFPKISFIGLLGLGGPRIGDVVDPSSLLGVALPRISWSLFDGGRAAAEVRSARGVQDEAEARYRQAILSALQDAEASLTRYGAQRIAYVKALETGERAVHAAGLQEQRASAGTISRSDSLSARRQALQADLAAASARADLATAFVAVQKALGLGWESPVTTP